jgi:PAS domain S-box-containing protein
MGAGPTPGGAGRALRVAGIYLLVSLAWIVGTDLLLVQTLGEVPGSMAWMQTLKGTAFVVVSTGVLYVLVRRELRRTGRSEERFRSLVEQSLVGVYLVRDNRFLYVNPRLAEVFGYTPREMMEEITVADAVAPEDRERVRANIRRRLDGSFEGLQYRFRGRKKDGTQIAVEVVGQRIPWEGENAVLGILLDVTYQDLMNEQLFRAQRMEAMGRLTGAVAHDFNNFLTAILGPLDYVVSELPDDSDHARELSEAREVAHRAASLTKQLMAFSRRRIAMPRPVDLHRSLDHLQPMLERLAGDRVRLRVEPGEERAVAAIDPSHFDQVLVNLVVNAQQAIEDDGEIWLRTQRLPAGHPELRRRNAEHKRSWVCVEVQDTGCGMTAETKAHIFEPFFTTKSEGSGLGLSTVHGIVTQAGGFVRVESVLSQGTRFRIVLPEAEGTPGEEVTERSTPETAGGTETVLLVEDEAAVRRVMAQTLRRAGYTVKEAASCAEARATSDPGDDLHILLCDLGLPDGSGVDVAQDLRDRDPEIRLLFVSGYSDTESHHRLDEVEGWTFLEKPFAVNELLVAVRESLDGEPAGEAAKPGSVGNRVRGMDRV